LYKRLRSAILTRLTADLIFAIVQLLEVGIH